jgi:hypothetical protein
VTDSLSPTLAAFGLGLVPEEQPPGAWQTDAALALKPTLDRRRALDPGRAPEPSLQIRMTDAAAIAQRWSGFAAIGWEGLIDGARFVVERGVAGDHRFVHGETPDEHGVPAAGTRALHHLDAGASVLRCAPADPTEPSWWRLLLDSVLFTVALLHGYEALHAGAIATEGGVVAITAGTGGGKSTLLTELLRRGAVLMADDVLVLEPRGTSGSSGPLAYPAPPLMSVPTERLSVLEEQGPVEVICALDGEQWIAAAVHPGGLPLKALVLLDRRPGLETSLARIKDPLALLLGSLMRFPSSPERQRSRFELASVLACDTALWHLTADVDTTPGVLADTLLAGTL